MNLNLIDLHTLQVASASLESSLLKYSAKEYFFRAALCHLCVDSLNAQHAIERYQEQYPAFQDAREYKLVKVRFHIKLTLLFFYDLFFVYYLIICEYCKSIDVDRTFGGSKSRRLHRCGEGIRFNFKIGSVVYNSIVTYKKAN